MGEPRRGQGIRLINFNRRCGTLHGTQQSRATNGPRGMRVYTHDRDGDVCMRRILYVTHIIASDVTHALLEWTSAPDTDDSRFTIATIHRYSGACPSNRQQLSVLLLGGSFVKGLPIGHSRRLTSCYLQLNIQ